MVNVKTREQKNQGADKKECASILEIGPGNGISPISAVWSMPKDSQSVR